MPLRIGYDAKRALHNSTGLGNYARGVLRGVHQGQPAQEIHLYTGAPPSPAFRDFPAEIAATLHLPVNAGTPLARATWRTFRLGRAAAADGVQLFHGLSHEIPRDLPRTGVRSVVTFHDIIFEKHPEYFALIDRLSYRWRYRWSAAHADAIVAVSGETRDDLVTRYHCDPARISVVPPARDPAFAVPVPERVRAETRARYDLPAEYLLSLGTLEPRKNQAMLLEALGRLPVDTPPLVLIGHDGGSLTELSAAIHRLGLNGRAMIRTAVQSADLPALMQSAYLFLFPSRAEGFGMPIVEALSAGVPVIAASGACLLEAGGPGSRYVAAGNLAGWVAAIGDILGNSGAIAAMRSSGIEHARLFDLERVAARLQGVYDAVMANGAQQ